MFLSVHWGGGGGGCFISDNLDHVRYECIALSLGCSGGVPKYLSVASSGRVTASPTVLYTRVVTQLI